MSKSKSSPPPEENDDLSDYRKHLVAAEQKAQEDFDKTVLSLSSAALGISFVFLKDVIGPNPIDSPNLLFGAWVSWGLSVTAVLFSYYLSHMALRKAIRQVDEGTIRSQKPGGAYRIATSILNAAGALLFLIGVVAITLFAQANFKPKGAQSGTAQVSATTAAASAAPATSSPTTSSFAPARSASQQ